MPSPDLARLSDAIPLSPFGLADAPEVVRLAPAGAQARTRVTRFMWGGDAGGVQVGLYRIDGAGHAEPSRLKRYPRFINWLTGRQNGDLEVAEAAWDFFRTKRAYAGSVPVDAVARGGQAAWLRPHGSSGATTVRGSATCRAGCRCAGRR